MMVPILITADAVAYKNKLSQSTMKFSAQEACEQNNSLPQVQPQGDVQPCNCFNYKDSISG